MPVEVSCPNCGAKLKAPDNMAGKKVKCKKCKTGFRMPGGSASAADTASEGQALSAMAMPTVPGAPGDDDLAEVMMAEAVDDLPPAPLPAAPAPAPVAAAAKPAKDVAALPSADPFDFGKSVTKPAPAAAAPAAPAVKPAFGTKSAPASAPVPAAKPAAPAAPAAVKPVAAAPAPAAPAAKAAVPAPAAKAAPAKSAEEPQVKAKPALPAPAAEPAAALPAPALPAPAGNPFTFPATDEDEKPKKAKRRDDDDEDVDDRPQKKKRDEEEDEDRPKKKRDEDEEKAKKKRDDEDDEDKPKKKKRDEEEDEDRAKKKRSDEDEKDDERAKKKKKRDEEDEDEDTGKKSKPGKAEPEFTFGGAPSEPDAAAESAPAGGNPFSFNALTEEPSETEKAKKKRDDEDEDDQPKKKKKRDDDDDDDRSSKSKRSKDDEDEDKPKKKKKGDEDDTDDKPRYQRKEGGKATALLITAVVGFIALALGITAIVVFVKHNRQQEETKKEEKKDEPPAPGGNTPPDQPPPKVDPKKDKDPPKKDPKNPDPKDPKGKDPEPAPSGRPFITFTGLKTFNVGTPGAKLAVSDPRKNALPANGPPLTLDVPPASVRRVFPPSDPTTGDTCVLIQTAAAAGGKNEKLALETYGPAGTRIASSRIEYEGDGLPAPIADMHTSVAGTFFLAGIGGKLNVWQIADKPMQVASGISPFADKPVFANAGLAAAFFAPNPKQIIAVSTAGAVLLYDLDMKKAVSEYIPANGAPGRVSLGQSVTKSAGDGSVLVAVAGVLYQIEAKSELSVARKIDLEGDVIRSIALAASGTPGRLLYVFEQAADKNASKKEIVALCVPLSDDKKRLPFLWPSAAAGDPKGALWTYGDVAGVSTDRGVVFFDDHEGNFKPLVFAASASGTGLYYGDEKHVWYVIPSAMPNKSAVVAITGDFNDRADFNRSYPNNPLKAVRLDPAGLAK